MFAPIATAELLSTIAADDINTVDLPALTEREDNTVDLMAVSELAYWADLADSDAAPAEVRPAAEATLTITDLLAEDAAAEHAAATAAPTEVSLTPFVFEADPVDLPEDESPAARAALPAPAYLVIEDLPLPEMPAEIDLF